MTPANMGATMPGMVAIVLLKEYNTPVYLGQMSKQFALYPGYAKPDVETATIMTNKATERSLVNPKATKDTAGNKLPVNCINIRTDLFDQLF